MEAELGTESRAEYLQRRYIVEGQPLKSEKRGENLPRNKSICKIREGLT